MIQRGSDESLHLCGRRCWVMAGMLPTMVGACDRTPRRDVEVAHSVMMGDARGAPTPVRVITLTARDAAFEAPDSLPAGLTVFRLVERAPRGRPAWFVRLEEGGSPEELRSMLGLGLPLPQWAHSHGGPLGASSGVSEAALVLEPGDYLIARLGPWWERRPQLARGMIRHLVVTPAAEPAFVAPPRADLILTLRDNGVRLSAPVTAGRRTLWVRNEGPGDHQLVIARLLAGGSAAKVRRWLATRRGSAPFRTLGGTAPIGPAADNLVTVDFAAGVYLFFCPAPNADASGPNVRHEVIRAFRVE